MFTFFYHLVLVDNQESKLYRKMINYFLKRFPFLISLIISLIIYCEKMGFSPTKLKTIIFGACIYLAWSNRAMHCM